jgi:hypothetical protein
MAKSNVEIITFANATGALMLIGIYCGKIRDEYLLRAKDYEFEHHVRELRKTMELVGIEPTTS